MRGPPDFITEAIAPVPGARQQTAVPAAEPARLAFVEGVRGVAALTVVLYHAYGHTLLYQPLTGWPAFFRDALGWILNGRTPVALFIVLSGFVLMLPVARAGGHQRDGFAAYFRRRARRILPPYFASLALSLLLVIAFPALREPVSIEWATSQPALTWPAISSHLLLLHNLSSATALKINPPLWTIATEWQLYFAFPLLLLPLWRRTGSAPTIVAALAITLGGVWLLGRGVSAAPWFAGLFAMGMAAATRVSSPLSTRGLRLYGAAAAALAAIYVVGSGVVAFVLFKDHGGIGAQHQLYWAFDVLVGAAVACGLVYCARVGDRSIVVRLFSLQPIVLLGVTSYSLYLIHDPLLALVRVGVARYPMQPFAAFGALVAIGVPLTLSAACLFHVVVERPFLSRRAKRRVEAEESLSGRTASREVPSTRYPCRLQKQP